MAESPSTAGKTTPNEIIGRMAGEYRLRRKLGEGGFGAVYEAEHPVLKRRAAVKVLHQVAGRDSEAVLRFVAEARAANQIRSRHITDIFSFGELPDGRHFYVMDLLEGEPLDRCLAREIRLDVATTLQLLRPIAQALDAAHAAGIVHRDLKPQNIFLAFESDGTAVPKLLDFGMAKLLGDSPVHTLSGTPLGTPLYMSPEQARGEQVDGRSDVYALGVLCHELLTGRLPITGDSTVVVLMAHLLQSAPRVSEVCPDLPPQLDQPILRMLDKNPAGRPATAGDALAELIQAAEEAGCVVPPGMPQVRRPLSPAAADAGDSPALPWTDADPTPLATTPPRATPEQPGRARWRLPLALAVVAIAGAYALPHRQGGSGTNGSSASARSTATPAAPSAPVIAAAPAPHPAGDPALPASLTPLTVTGAPKGARVWVAGSVVGEAPGPLSLPFGDVPLQVTIAAPGYESAKLDLVPNRPLDVTVKLKKRLTRPPARDRIPSDLESPF